MDPNPVRAVSSEKISMRWSTSGSPNLIFQQGLGQIFDIVQYGEFSVQATPFAEYALTPVVIEAECLNHISMK